jgi:hypothetical protein
MIFRCPQAHTRPYFSCDGSPLARIPPSGPRAYDHEQIASFCARSAKIGPQYESYEGEWAASEVGESVEEIWDRSVSACFGRIILLSTDAY